MAKKKTENTRGAADPEASAPASEGTGEESGPKLTYLGPGPLSGEYRFAEIPGSISAASEEEAKEKARELVTKHPAFLAQ